ncbi:MAG: nuclear transport factor 2 family protein [Jatrophihabitans sp.]|nr:MAG: nuclear transport factor 2 family protein [Jatrophihabitans sp.]
MSATTSVDDRLAAVEARLRRVEDELAITRLVLSYGPAVDSGSAEATAALWDDGGRYDFQDGAPVIEGSAAMASMVRSPGHRAHLARGCAHVLTAPAVRVDGDRAVALCYSLMHHYVSETGIFQVSRVSANRWELVRGPSGWRVGSRVNRLLTGDEAARALLAGG